MTHQMSPAREFAYDAYIQVMEKGRAPEDVLDQMYQGKGRSLSRLDRNFIKEILYGALRWYAKIYWILQNTASRDLAQVAPEVRAALVLGTYQIFYMDRVPDRAAVNESVEYIRKRGQAQAVSFINGILRQIARRAEYFKKPDKKTQAVEYLSLQFAHPQWIVRRWHEHFNFERMEKMLAANNQPPPWTVRINLLKTSAQDVHLLQQQLLRDEKTHTERRPLRLALRFKDPPNFDAASLFGRGYFTIQDEASQLVSQLVQARPQEFIVDAAAGPGGKLTHVFELAEGQANILAIEKNPEQMRRAKQTAERMGHHSIKWLEQDFLEWTPDADALPHKILLDAPCSGLGVLRRHPEGKWQKQGSIVPLMAELQKAMLEHALWCLPVGGELIYSVCSFEPEETVQHLTWIKEKYGANIELVSPVSRLPDYYKRYVTRDNVLVIYSGNQDEMDGFGAFILRLKTALPGKRPIIKLERPAAGVANVASNPDSASPRRAGNKAPSTGKARPSSKRPEVAPAAIEEALPSKAPSKISARDDAADLAGGQADQGVAASSKPANKARKTKLSGTAARSKKPSTEAKASKGKARKGKD